MNDLPLIFEALCEAIFKELGFNVEHNSDRDWGVDISAEKDGELVLAEVKWTHRPMVYVRLLRDWVPSASKVSAPSNATVRLLVSGTVDAASRAWAEGEFGIRIWDREDLLSLPIGDDMRSVMSALFSLSDDAPAGFLDATAREALEATLQAYIVRNDINISTRRPALKLIGRLKNMPSGAADAKRYEELCFEIMDFLFGGSLVNPLLQPSTDDDLSIMDIIYRVSPTANNIIWNTITRDFRARVIVFECKNYTDAIGPMQVYTTERYMSLKALRPLCFMVTREKPKPNAYLAAQAALRDSGRLVVFLDDKDLTDMLLLRESQLLHRPGTEEWIGKDPAEHLDQKIYELLATMPR
ncbi:restriction endonuclease [Rhizobium leguminosarum]|uniref:restriction endonuclease n=1 Tax=Rhizobium leguminosarum TaxID=384 RepID=UPI003F9559EE